MGFGVPLDAWFRGLLRAWGRELLEGLGRREVVSPRVVSALEEEHASGRRDRGAVLWSLVMLELWFREVHEAAPADSRRTAGAASWTSRNQSSSMTSDQSTAPRSRRPEACSSSSAETTRGDTTSRRPSPSRSSRPHARRRPRNQASSGTPKPIFLRATTSRGRRSRAASLSTRFPTPPARRCSSGSWAANASTSSSRKGERTSSACARAMRSTFTRMSPGR